MATAGTEEQLHTSKPVMSPNGRFAAVTIVPLGNETAFLARTRIYDVATKEVRQTFPGYLPTWLDGGSSLQLETMDRRLTIYAIDETSHHATQFQEVASQSIATDNRNRTESDATQSPRLAVSYPLTIRVAHHPSNGCRDVADWQVETIPFEEYVARVVPAETPAWWPLDALAAQAVAARTYAWRQILVGRVDYDVTDWANFQMMCDARYPNSDRAASMTQGQYLVTVNDAQATPILAMYSAENGHPTLTNSNVSYLQSVPDRFAIGRDRWGHGYGLSQWGAYRRALAGQSYRQILGHYYSNIYLRDGLVPTRAVGALLGIDPAYSVATASITLRAMRPPGVTAHYLISTTAGLTEAITLESRGNSTERISWRSNSPLAHGSAITASLWISGEQQDRVRWVVDHQPPPRPSLTQPLTVTAKQFTLTLLVGSEGDQPLLSAGWQWAGTALDHTPNSGAAIADEQSSTGMAWAADPAQHSAGVWYGPYTTALPAGHSYRALFWLRTATPMSVTRTSTPIAYLDVADDEGRLILGMRDLLASDFANSAAYTPIAVDFHLFSAPKGLEFRVNWPGNVALALDQITIWRLPDTVESSATQIVPQATAATASFGWRLTSNAMTQILQQRTTDLAGNLSAMQPYTLTVIDREPPNFGNIEGASAWISSDALTLSTTVSDALSGIDLATSALRVSKGDFVQNPPIKVDRYEASADRATLRALLQDLSDGIYTATFTIEDQAQNMAAKSQPIRIDRSAPVVTITGSNQLGGEWQLDALTLTISGLDQGSGVREVRYTQQKAPAPLGQSSLYTAPIQLDQGGIYTITAWAIDGAGNQSNGQRAQLRLDLLPPTLILSQSMVNSTTARIDWQANDDGSGVATVAFEIQYNEGDWQPIATKAATAYTKEVITVQGGEPIEVTLDPQGQTRVRGRAQDAVGRTSAWVELTLWRATDWIFLPLINR